jgi:hypothetical protein
VGGSLLEVDDGDEALEADEEPLAGDAGTVTGSG